MVRRAEALMETQRRSKKRLLGEVEALGGGKRARVEGGGDMGGWGQEVTSDAPDCAVSVFKLPVAGQLPVK